MRVRIPPTPLHTPSSSKRQGTAPVRRKRGSDSRRRLSGRRSYEAVRAEPGHSAWEYVRLTYSNARDRDRANGSRPKDKPGAFFTEPPFVRTSESSCLPATQVLVLGPACGSWRRPTKPAAEGSIPSRVAKRKPVHANDGFPKRHRPGGSRHLPPKAVVSVQLRAVTRLRQADRSTPPKRGNAGSTPAGGTCGECQERRPGS